MIWKLNGTLTQQALITQALSRCDFPFYVLTPSLAKEGKTAIAVDWEDLSRFNTDEGQVGHVHTGNHLHTIERVVNGRLRTLGLFYLPPFTRVIMDLMLETRPELAIEVFLSEGAHAVDYHYMTNAMRIVVWNALHEPTGDLADSAVVQESGDLHHGHSWFDGPGGYNTWVGEAFMEAFVRAFAPTVPVTIHLDHPTSPEAAHTIRHAVSPTPHGPVVPQPPTTPLATADVALAAAARRYLGRLVTVGYLQKALRDWLAAHPELKG